MSPVLIFFHRQEELRLSAAAAGAVGTAPTLAPSHFKDIFKQDAQAFAVDSRKLNTTLFQPSEGSIIEFYFIILMTWMVKNEPD